MKFGGTSVGDAAAIRRVAGIVAGRRGRSPVVIIDSGEVAPEVFA
jgi:aspartokinase